MAHARIIDGANVPQRDGPTISMSKVENIAARKFLRFAVDDVRYQIEKMASDRTVKKSEFEEAKQAAVVISAYMASLLQELDAVLGEPVSPSTKLQ